MPLKRGKITRSKIKRVKRFKISQYHQYKKKDEPLLEMFFDPTAPDGVGIPTALFYRKEEREQGKHLDWIVDPAKLEHPLGLTVSEVKELIKQCEAWLKRVKRKSLARRFGV